MGFARRSFEMIQGCIFDLILIPQKAFSQGVMSPSQASVSELYAPREVFRSMGSTRFAGFAGGFGAKPALNPKP